MEIKYMERAIELAKMGMGYTNPNPMVGAVIVKDSRIIGEGYHEYHGGPHAEINAFKNVTEDVNGATMYVTLEPCSHFGRTPPCAHRIVHKGISKVIISMIDPNPLVAGKGIEILRGNGIEVVTGMLGDKSKTLNEIFVKYITQKLPFCILKTAMTLDGKIASVSGDSRWISNNYSRNYVHGIRHQVSAIMVGVGTVIQDDPTLTTRLENQKGIDAARIIVDSYLRTPLTAKVLNLKSNARTIIATSCLADNKRLEKLKGKGAEIIKTNAKNNRVDLIELMKILGKKEFDSVLIEGGATLNYSALEDGIVDKVITFIAPKILGGSTAKTPVGGQGKEFIKDAVHLRNIEIRRFDQDIMLEGYINKEDG